MMLICNFLESLTMVRKSFQNIHEIVKKADGDKALKRMQMYVIIKKVNEEEWSVDQKHFNAKAFHC
jgi:hypothetical protein